MKNGMTEHAAHHLNNLVDFHTHILPGVDDGSKTVEESMTMIRALVESGVRYIALTPHFYAGQDNPEHFFRRRNKAFDLLKSAALEEFGADRCVLIPGAEVEYFEGITVMSELEKFTLGDSNCLLLEMPMCRWTSHIIDDILEMHSRGGIRVVLAHVERYLFAQKKETIHKLMSAGVVMQVNTSFFTDRLSSGRAIRKMKQGLIHVIGTDCHNMKTRSPNIDKACAVISAKAGNQALEDSMSLARMLLKVN